MRASPLEYDFRVWQGHRYKCESTALPFLALNFVLQSAHFCAEVHFREDFRKGKSDQYCDAVQIAIATKNQTSNCVSWLLSRYCKSGTMMTRMTKTC